MHIYTHTYFIYTHTCIDHSTPTTHTVLPLRPLHSTGPCALHCASTSLLLITTNWPCSFFFPCYNGTIHLYCLMSRHRSHKPRSPTTRIQKAATKKIKKIKEEILKKNVFQRNVQKNRTEKTDEAAVYSFFFFKVCSHMTVQFEMQPSCQGKVEKLSGSRGSRQCPTQTTTHKRRREFPKTV